MRVGRRTFAPDAATLCLLTGGGGDAAAASCAGIKNRIIIYNQCKVYWLRLVGTYER